MTEESTLHEEISVEIERLTSEIETSYQRGYDVGFEAGKTVQSDENRFALAQAQHYAALLEAAEAEVRRLQSAIRLRSAISEADKRVRAALENDK